MIIIIILSSKEKYLSTTQSRLQGNKVEAELYLYR